MQRLQKLVDTYSALKLAERGGVLATVVNARGDLERHLGSRMLLLEDGTLMGTLGDDDLTAEVAKRIAGFAGTGEPMTVSFTRGAPAIAPRSGPSPVMEVLVEPLPPGGRSLHLVFIAECLQAGEGVIASVVRVDGEVRASIGSHLLLSLSGTIEEDIRNPVLTAAITKDCIGVLRSRATIIREYRFTEGIVEVLIEFITAS